MHALKNTWKHLETLDESWKQPETSAAIRNTRILLNNVRNVRDHYRKLFNLIKLSEHLNILKRTQKQMHALENT